MSFKVGEQCTAKIKGVLRDEDGTAIDGATITSLGLTLYDKVTGNVINSRDHLNILNVNGGSVDSGGNFAWIMTPSDNMIVNDSLNNEEHHALIEFTYSGGRQGKKVVVFVVENLVKVPGSVPPPGSVTLGLSPTNTLFVSPGFAGQSAPYYATIQAAVDAADGVNATTILIYPGTYALSSSLILKNSVNLVGSSMGDVILSGNFADAAVKDNGALVVCSITNLTIKQLAGNYGLRIEHASSSVTCVNVSVESAGSIGVRNLGTVVGVKATGLTCGIINYGTAERCKGICVGNNGFTNSGGTGNGTARYCIGESTNGDGFSNSGGARAYHCEGFNAWLGSPAFNNIGSLAFDCTGTNTQQDGFLNTGGAYAFNCTGISTGAGGGGVSVGFVNGVPAGNDVSIAKGCHGIASHPTLGGEGFNNYPDAVALNCTGTSIIIDGFGNLGGYAENCSGFSQNQQGFSAFNCVVFGGKDQGSISINCSGLSTGRLACLTQGNDNKIFGGSFVSTFNNAIGNGIGISGTAPVTGTEIYNVSIRVRNAGASSIFSNNVATNVKYAGVAANAAVNGNTVQAIIAVVDGQGNLFG